MFSALSANHGDLQDKLNLFIALAPIINVANSPNSVMQNAASQWHLLESSVSLFRIYELKDSKTDANMKAFCVTFGLLCDAVNSLLNIGTSPWNDPEISDVCD
jgi:hypothetical protein